MLYLNFSDGSALTLDLGTEEGERGWSERADDPAFHRSVRGLSLAVDGNRADLPLPRRFREILFSAEVLRDAEGTSVAERVSVNADGVLLSLTMYLNGRSGRFRVDLDKRGRSRFRPGSLR